MNKHTENSSYREKLIEHLFAGELLKHAWTHHDGDLEIGKPEVDNAGYDLILEANKVIRHVQLKASFHGSSTARQKLHIKLGDKPSGCVIWIVFDRTTLELGPFLFFGNQAGEPLPSLVDQPIAKHTKANAAGEKLERPNIRVLNKGAFTSITSIAEVYAILFE